MSHRKIAPTLSALLHGNRLEEITGPTHPALRELRALLAVARVAQSVANSRVMVAGHFTSSAASLEALNRALARLDRASRSTGGRP